ncbi:unnamed protein product [Pedinophyceae sp. YPF-701]|nr:unnamed protein product [Pedinophyceae sp. YPF-701]
MQGSGEMGRADKHPARGLGVVFAPTSDPKHHGGITSLALSDGGFTVFTGSRDATVRRWDVGRKGGLDGRCTGVYVGHTGWVNDVVLCGDVLVSCSNDHTVRVWPTTGDAPSPLHTYAAHADYVSRLAGASDRSMVVSAGLGGEIFLWDVHAARQAPVSRNTPPGVSASPIWTSPTPGAPTSPAANGSGAIESAAGLTTSSLYRPPPCSLYAVACSPSASVIAAGGTDHAIRLYDPRAARQAHELRAHSDIVRDLCVSPDGQLLVSASSDDTIRLWDLGQARCVSTYRVHRDSCWAVACDETFSVCYSGGRDGGIARTVLNNGASDLLAREERPVLAIAVDEEEAPGRSARVWTGTLSSTVSSYDVPTTRGPRRASLNMSPMKRHSSGTSPVVVSPLRKSTPDAEAAEPIAAPGPQLLGTPPIVRAAPLTDRLHVLTQDQVGGVAVWDLALGQPVHDLGVVDLRDAERELWDPTVAPPAWCAVDVSLGTVQVRVKPPSCFYAEAYAKQTGLSHYGDDEKVNLGGTLLQGALCAWADAQGAKLSEYVGDMYGGGPAGPVQGVPACGEAFAARMDRAVKACGARKTAAHASADKPRPPGPRDAVRRPFAFAIEGPPVRIMCEDADDVPWAAVCSTPPAWLQLPSFVPPWLAAWALRGDLPAGVGEAGTAGDTRMSFTLLPAPGSALPPLEQDTLMAPKILSIRKVAHYMQARLREAGATVGVFDPEGPQPTPAQVSAAGGCIADVTLRGAVLPWTMTLAAVQARVVGRAAPLSPAATQASVGAGAPSPPPHAASLILEYTLRDASARIELAPLPKFEG